MYFGVWVLKLVKGGPAAPIETFARFQAGFLSSEDFHRFLPIFTDLHDFYVFQFISFYFLVFSGIAVLVS